MPKSNARDDGRLQFTGSKIERPTHSRSTLRRPTPSVTSVTIPAPHILRRLVALPLAASFAVAWWSPLRSVCVRWSEPTGSHGALVVLMAAALAWKDRRVLVEAHRPSAWIGVALILTAVALRIAGNFFSLEALTFGSLIPAIAGLCVAVFGSATERTPRAHRSFLAALAPALGVLALSLPLPHFLETEATASLQRASTRAAVFALQTCGLPVFSVGNILQAGEVKVGVAEACSGLRLLTVQIVLTFLIAFWTARPAWQRVVLIASAPFIAIATNAARLAGTLLAHRHADPQSIPLIHDLLGWLTSPLALAAVALELAFLRRIAPEASLANGLAGDASKSVAASGFTPHRSTWNAL